MPASCWRSIPARSSAAARRWCISALIPGRCEMPTVPGGVITAIVGGRLIDGTGAEPVGDGLVLIDGDGITYAGSARGQSIPRGARTIDAAGASVLPGLMDVHVHISLNAPSDLLREVIAR